MKIPLIDLQAQYRMIGAQMELAVRDVMVEQIFIGGRAVQLFEEEFGKACGAPYCIGVGNGTDALTLSLKALGIGPGDQVLTAANSFIASSEAITIAGAKPVFVDCDPSNYLMSFDHLEKLLQNPGTSDGRIRAIIPVHLYGRSLDMTRLMEVANRFNVLVIEDCAQAHLATWKGRHVGTFGVTGCFSFYPGKNLGAYGDAGAVITSNPELAEKIRMWRNHGRVQKYDHEFEGTNSRLDTIQAAILNVKLPHLLEWNRTRRHHALLYHEMLKGIPDFVLPEIPSEDQHVFHLFVVRTSRRDDLKAWLQNYGIETGIHYPLALPNSAAYRYLGCQPIEYPVATAYQKEILSLPMYPELTTEDIRYVATQIGQFFKTARNKRET
jgi:dTDP-4-amino-4,6-dideoxygalactose transaminase